MGYICKLLWSVFALLLSGEGIYYMLRYGFVYAVGEITCSVYPKRHVENRIYIGMALGAAGLLASFLCH